ncbi:TetR family transcriptional regulator C-terminal domain-containing protein [Kitasatospora sp. NPDC002227]|uniref:TetR/AcrR family transcriptional regulator n=1 Tax=Kitasatospora sp. NPDC002227 TaxID=3154773 RepID=UPI00331CA085
MPPARGDHEARRAEVSEAVWQVLAERGFGGLTLRAVAARMGASTGLLTHYFSGKRALVAYALDVLEKRNEERARPATEALTGRAGVDGGSTDGAPTDGASTDGASVVGASTAEPSGSEAPGFEVSGFELLRAALVDVLPVTPAGMASNRIWVGSWDAALVDPELSVEHAERYRRSRRRMAEYVVRAQQAGELPAEPAAADLAAGAQSFVLGLVVQALFAPGEFPPERQVALLDAYLDGLRGGQPGAPTGG